MTARTRWSGRLVALLFSVSLLRVLGAGWLMSGVTAAALMVLAVQRARAADRQGKLERGVDADASVNASRTMRLDLEPGRALAVVAHATERLASVVTRSIRVDPLQQRVTARVGISRDGRWIFFGERVRAVVVGDESGARVELSSQSLVPAATDQGKNAANLRALAQLIRETAAESGVGFAG